MHQHEITKALNEELMGLNLIVKNQLVETRYWTKELIRDFLKPVEIRANPHNPQQQMVIYDLEKVFEVEKSKAFRERVSKLASGKAFVNAQKQLQRERNQLHKQIRLEQKRTKLPGDWKAGLEAVGLA